MTYVKEICMWEYTECFQNTVTSTANQNCVSHLFPSIHLSYTLGNSSLEIMHMPPLCLSSFIMFPQETQYLSQLSFYHSHQLITFYFTLLILLLS